MPTKTLRAPTASCLWPAVAALALALVLLAATPAGRALARAALLTVDIVLQPAASPLRLLARPAIQESVQFPCAGGTMDGELFRPAGGGRHGAVILAMGYAPGLSDPLLNRLAEDLARLGFVVLIPRTPNLRQGLLAPEDVEVLIGAFQWLAGRPEVATDHVGFAGFCVGSSLALLAAEDPHINNRVAYVHAFGGYFSARDLLRAIAVRSVLVNGAEQPWQPAPQAVLLFVQNLLAHVETAADRALIEQAVLHDSAVTPAGLTPLDRQIYALLTTHEPGRVEALLNALPPTKQFYLDTISPSRGARQVRARVFIMHDQDDPYVPASEAERLAATLPPATRPTLTRFVLFNHMHPTKPLGWLALTKESVRLIVHLSRVLAAMSPN